MFGIGGIYSDQRCPFPDCGGTYVDDLKSCLSCPDHPWHIASTFKVEGDLSKHPWGRTGHVY
jgi:hypothetical protein